MDDTADDGVQHTIWLVNEAETLAQITEEFDAMESIYIADGHHRSAAASRVAAQRKAANPNHTGDEDYNYFLSVIFPDNQMKILDYNRVVRDLAGLTPDGFLDRVAERKCVSSQQAVHRGREPARNGRLGPNVTVPIFSRTRDAGCGTDHHHDSNRSVPP